MELHPGGVEAYLQPGFLYLFVKGPQKALWMARAAMERRPDLAKRCLLMGNIYLKQKEFQMARGYFESATRSAQSSRLKRNG